MKWLRFLFIVVLVLGVAAPVAAWSQGVGGLNDSQEPGSVLVFYKFEANTTLTPDQGTVPTTQFEISVTCPNDLNSTCLETGSAATGQAVFLRAHWVCPAFSAEDICRETDFPLSTTVFGTIKFDAAGRTPGVPEPPCFEGYLIVWVVDAAGNPISFNGLIGDAVLRGSGTSARAYNALPIQSPLPSNSFTDVNGNLALDFDGSEYQAITGTIYGSVKYPNSADTRLILLTLDVLSNQPNPQTDVGLKFYNESEFFISTSASFRCWREFDLGRFAGGALFGNDFFDQKGLVRSTAAVQGGRTPTVVGIVETREFPSLQVDTFVSETLSASEGLFTTAATCVLNGGGTPCAASCTFGTHCILRLPPALGGTCILEGPDVSCTVSGTVTTFVGLTREYAYPLLNDSVPVATTFTPLP